MRKLLTLLFFMSLAGILMAQSPSSSADNIKYKTFRDIKPVSKENIQQINHSSSGNRADDLPYYWINFNDAIDEQYNGGTLANLAPMPLWPDSTVKVVGDDAGTPFEFFWWIHSFASMLDPTSQYIADWVDNNYTLIGSARDWFNKDHAFLVDSIAFQYFYDRYDNTVTDTLKVYVMGPGSTVHQFGTLGDPAYNAAYFRYYNDENRPNGTYTEYTYLLSNADTASAISAVKFMSVNIEIPKAPSGNVNKISIAWSFRPGQTYSYGDTLIDAQDVPTVTKPLNTFWLITNEELLSSLPISYDEGTYNQDGNATSEVRYDISTTGWNGYYINTFAFLSPEYAYEHAYVDYRVAPKGANFLQTSLSPCENLTLQFNDLSNFVVDAGSADYYWDFGDGDFALEQNPVHTYSAPGTFTVCEVVTEGAESFQQCKNVVANNCTDAVNDIESLNGFALYPNPAADVLQINLTFSETENISLNILNVQGEIVYTKNADNIINYQDAINISNLPAGMYIMEVSSNNKIATNTFVISR